MALLKQFDLDNDVVTNIKQTLSSGMWSGGVGTLTTFYTSSTQSGSSGEYFYDVYKTDPSSDSTAEVQFGIAYGNRHGSGSKGTIGGATGNRASAAIYSQFRNILLGPNSTQFTFGGGVTSDDGYFITINRARMREKVDPGNWELHITGSGNTLIKLIDDSGATTNPDVGTGGRVFNIVSGSISSGTAVTKYSAANQPGGGYGLFYPDLGIIVLHPTILDASASLATDRSSDTLSNNAGKLYDKIKGASYFAARREEKISSTHYFCRAFNKEFNFSTNPTFFTSSDGTMTNSSFVKNPQVYITTVGLYNDNNELLAVAKLSKPILKNYSREALIKVKLDF